MASAIFVVSIVDGQPQIDTQAILTSEPQEGWGYSIIGQVPTEAACLVRIWSSGEVLELLAADPNYEFIEDVP